MFIYAVVVIIVLSVVLAFRSLHEVNSKRELEDARRNLEKGRVIFQSTSSSGGESSESSSS